MVIKHTIREVRVDILLPYPHPEAIYPLPPPTPNYYYHYYSLRERSPATLVVSSRTMEEPCLGQALPPTEGGAALTAVQQEQRAVKEEWLRPGQQQTVDGGVGVRAYKDRRHHGTTEAQGPLHSKRRAEKEDLQLARERSETGREQRKGCPGCRGANGRRNSQTSPVTVLRHQGSKETSAVKQDDPDVSDTVVYNTRGVDRALPRAPSGCTELRCTDLQLPFTKSREKKRLVSA